MKIKVRIKQNVEKVEITSEFIRLDNLLKFCGAAQTGGHAKLMIQEGMVLVNGEVCEMRGKKIYPGDMVQCENTIYEVKIHAD